MASGSVLKYEGKRGVVWRILYRDASGRQIKESVGKERDGWNRKKAEAALRAKLVEVEQNAYTKPNSVTFAAFAADWLDTHADARGLKRSTRASYVTIVNRHLLPAFGKARLADITVERIEAYLRSKRREGLAPTSLHRHLATLSLIFGAARRKRLVNENPVGLVERPKATRRRWRILTPAEVAGVRQAWDEMFAEAEPGSRQDDLRVSRMLFQTMLLTGIRRGEALGLRWRHVHLADPAGPTLHVEETYVRAAADTPKSEAGQRTISLGSTLAADLFDFRAESPFDEDDERVFANPRTGNPFNPTVYAGLFREALKRAGVEGHIRPFHDIRHSSITNSAVAGISPEALMNRAGHSDFATTRRYIDAAGVRFRDEAEALERRFAGGDIVATEEAV